MKPTDHFMVGLTSCMLLISYKMFPYAPIVALLMVWFNMNLFNAYCYKRKNDDM